MAAFSGTLPITTQTTSGQVTWTATVEYTVTPSTDLTKYSVTLVLKVSRNGSNTSHNTSGNSYVNYTVNGVQSSNASISWTVAGGSKVTIGTYTYDVSSDSVDFSSGIPITVYWYTGLTSSSYTPKDMTVSGTIAIPEEHAGLVYISNGSSWDKYMVYISDGSSWNRYIPYISDGSTWIMCS